MSDTTILSPDVGQPPISPAAGEPAGASPQAVPPVVDSAPAATSGTAPTTGNQASTTPEPTADQAFKALLAEPATDTTPAPAAPQTTAAPAPAQAPPATPPPAASEPPAAEPETDEPSPAEVQAKTVPLKKLTRALETRRAAKDEAERVKTELTKERQITDRVLDVFNAIGVTPQQLNPFLANLARAKTDQQAQAQVLALLGVQPQAQARPTVDQGKLMAALEAYDVDAVKAHLASAGILSAPQQTQQLAQTTPTQAPAPQPPPEAQPRPSNADPAMDNPLIQTVATMGQVLRAQYGEPEAKRLANLIDAEAKATIERLNELEVDVSAKGAAKIWQAAQAKVIQRESAGRQQQSPQPVASPPPAHQQQTLRPTHAPAPRAQTADEMFAAIARSR